MEFMLPELLIVLAHKHIVFYEDYHSFARVCKSWHIAALEAAKSIGLPSHLPSLIFSKKKEDEECPEFHFSKVSICTMRLPVAALTSIGNGPPSRLPSLLLSHHNKKDKEFRGLFLLSDKSIRKIRLPEAYGKLYMSSYGWLLTVGNNRVAQLINPLSREIINLPKLDTFPQFLESSLWYIGIWKLVLVAPLSSVVVLWGCSRRLGFCRIGDNRWTAVQKGWNGSISDITYYNGRLYCFDFNHHVRSCDVNGENPTNIVVVSRIPKELYNKHLYGGYILGFDDDERKKLLVVIKEGVYDNSEDKSFHETYKTKRFQIFEYDLQNGQWSSVKDLGSKTLFVGYSSSFWMEDTTGTIKGNCIYYTDDLSELFRRSKNGGGGDMGIYHLSDGSIEPHFAGNSRSYLTPPIWLQSA